MAVTVKISETYDLKTTTNKLGIIGVHTPSSRQLRTMYPGLVKNYKFARLLKCDIVGACASVLPADPLQVGVSSGSIAPEDMFNPILYKPVSNESFETIVSRIYATTDVTTLGSLAKEDSTLSPFDVYYSLLAENKRWKKAMPQRGFGLRGLYPICYQMINTFGQTIPANVKDNVLAEDGTAVISETDDTGVTIAGGTNWANSAEQRHAVTFRGKSVKMPRIPMHYGPEDVTSVEPFYIPKTWVALFLVPPCRLHEIYYRMRVTWTIRFEGLATAQEFAKISDMSTLASYSYGKDYTYPSSKAELEHSESMVDTNGMDLNKIMDS